MTKENPIIKNFLPEDIQEKMGCRLIDATFSDLISALVFSNSWDYVPKEDEILSTDEFADYMKVDKRTLFRIIETGGLPDIRRKIGKQWKWNVRAAWNPEVLREINSSCAK